jgi:hypothetical protein
MYKYNMNHLQDFSPVEETVNTTANSIILRSHINMLACDNLSLKKLYKH